MNDVVGVAVATRVVTVALGTVAYMVAGSYDTSAELVLDWGSPWNIFVRWDAIYFLDIAQRGYVYEQASAFFPLLPYLAHALSVSVFKPLHVFLGEQYTLVLAAALISNISFVLAAVYLYKLTRAVYPSHPRLARYASIAFCVSLPSMFMSAFYTESLFALLTFMGMYAAVKGQYLAASLVWAIASATRSNAIVYAGFFFYDLVWQQKRVSRIVLGLLRAMVYSGVTVSGFGGFQWLMYRWYCQGSSFLSPRPWCSASPPLAYTYIQKAYWDNGFMAYYELKQVPNFLLAMPVIALSVYGLYVYALRDWRWVVSLGKTRVRALDASKGKKKEGDADYARALPFMVLWAFLLVYATTCMHVQVILRFFTSVPPLYWTIGQLWLDGFGAAGANCTKRAVARISLLYFVLYGLVGTVLFACFLPPA
ncbi:GPI mannosyltransferase 2 [Gongronella butleri]|nr:GPI mannosyltransferase 2 [Gongronella butleri]